MPFRIVPERSERPEYLIQSARAKGGDIFDEDVARLERVDRFGVLKPESAAFSAKSGAFPGEANVLAGKSAAQEINRFNGLPINGSDVSVSLHCRPVFGEHSLTVGVDFNLPRDIKTGSFKAKVKPSYACKKAPDSHLLPRQFPNDDHYRVFELCQSTLGALYLLFERGVLHLQFLDPQFKFSEFNAHIGIIHDPSLSL